MRFRFFGAYCSHPRTRNSLRTLQNKGLLAVLTESSLCLYLHDFSPLIESDMRNRSQGNREYVSCMPTLTFADEGSFFDQIREIAGRRGWRRASYSAVLSGAHAAF